jgi:hypothetical protein
MIKIQTARRKLALDYDVDWISVRAGWALENLTFQKFGFREGVINEADLFKAVIKRG